MIRLERWWVVLRRPLPDPIDRLLLVLAFVTLGGLILVAWTLGVLLWALRHG